MSPVVSVFAQGDPFDTVPNKRDYQDFEDITITLTRLDELKIMTGDYTQGVTFDEDLARESGFSEKEITLGRQIAEVTNNLIAQAKAFQADGELNNADVFVLDLQQYPELEQYLNDATRLAMTRIELEALHEETGNSLQIPERVRLPARYRVCGYFGHPVPSRAAPWRTYHHSNPASLLRSRGFHPTPRRLFGGGWTRPQTYKWWLCGWSTYRDHAIIKNASTYIMQNYTGRVPGEPNPEIWRSGPWPYPTWPLYVWWWHGHF